MAVTNFFNLGLLFTVGVAFIMCVVSVTNAMFDIQLVALPMESTSSSSPSGITTTAAPSSIMPPRSVDAPTNETPATTLTTTELVTVAPGNATTRLPTPIPFTPAPTPSVDFPTVFQYFSITCNMFGNCTRSGAGVKADKVVGDLAELSNKAGCGDVLVMRGFCLVTLVFAVAATACAAGAAQEIKCAQIPQVRLVILGCSSATFIFSLIALVLIALLKQCFTDLSIEGRAIVGFFTAGRVIETKSVESIAFAVYITCMSLSALAVGLCVSWYVGKIGPEAVAPPPPPPPPDAVKVADGSDPASGLEHTAQAEAPLLTLEELGFDDDTIHRLGI